MSSLLERAQERRAARNQNPTGANLDLMADIARWLGVQIDAEGCARVLLAMKLMRLFRDPRDFDTQVDIAGYLDMLAEVQAGAQAEPEIRGRPYLDDLPF